ncbi:MAG: hypothetical protein M3P82_00325, partial [Bacteroidota bacterium]|nr:hypothetical protein [Bacteroidota bacterium]
NTIEFKTKNETIPRDDLFSSYVIRKQAKVQKSTADRNIDFTAELKLLIKDDNSKTELRQSKGFKIDKGNNKDNGVADSKEYSTGRERIQKSFESSENGVYGHGFEYNYIIVENKNKIEKKKTDRKKSNSSESFIPFQNYETYKSNECYRERVVNKVRVIVPNDSQSFDEVGEEMEAERDRKSDRPEVIIPFENGDDEDM